jgi:hypothetical protein
MKHGWLKFLYYGQRPELSLTQVIFMHGYMKQENDNEFR